MGKVKKCFCMFFFLLMFSFKEAVGDDNKISISYSNTAGNTDAQTISISYSLEKISDTLRFYSEGSYFYKKDSGEETANKLVINNRAELSITKKVLFFVRNFVNRDVFSGYNFRIGLGPGVGYQLIKKDNESFILFFGTDFVYNDYTDGKTKSYTSGDVRLEYSKQLFRDLTFNQEVAYLFSFENNRDYFIHSETNFEVPFTENLALGVSYSVDYHNLLLGGAKYHLDRVFSTSIIFKF